MSRSFVTSSAVVVGVRTFCPVRPGRLNLEPRVTPSDQGLPSVNTREETDTFAPTTIEVVLKLMSAPAVDTDPSKTNAAALVTIRNQVAVPVAFALRQP